MMFALGGDSENRNNIVLSALSGNITQCLTLNTHCKTPGLVFLNDGLCFDTNSRYHLLSVCA